MHDLAFIAQPFGYTVIEYNLVQNKNIYIHREQKAWDLILVVTKESESLKSLAEKIKRREQACVRAKSVNVPWPRMDHFGNTKVGTIFSMLFIHIRIFTFFLTFTFFLHLVSHSVFDIVLFVN